MASGTARRIPSDYEIGTSRLLYYVARGGFEVNLPTSAWYQRHQVASPLSCGGRWELFETFEDPRATTYGSYVRLQRDQELADDRIRSVRIYNLWANVLFLLGFIVT